MESSFIFQNLFNFLMLGVIYAIIAVGFSLYFGVVDVIQFAHSDVLTLGAYAGLGGILLIGMLGIDSNILSLLAMLVCSFIAVSLIGAFIGRYLVLPLKESPPINVLLITLMIGTAIREILRIAVPGGSNPKPFPMILPDTLIHIGGGTTRISSLIILIVGVAIILGVYLLLTRTKLGLAIRSVAQDTEVAKFMGINFKKIVIITFILGSFLGALAGMMSGLYYRQITFNMGLMLGVIGFCSAVVGGLGNLLGAVLGGFLFSALQMFATVALPMPSAYKDVFAFGIMILIIAIRPTGLLRERYQERV